MTKLNAPARTAIREAGFTQAQWRRMWGYNGDEWGGDACGCFDDRCIGHHHDGADGCGCLESMLDDAVRWRRATRSPNTVELEPHVHALFGYVSVAAPGTLVSVSTTAGGLRRTDTAAPVSPAESIVTLEARDGWEIEVSQDDRGRMVIRFVKPLETGGAG